MRRNLFRAFTVFGGVLGIKLGIEPLFLGEVMDVIATKKTETG
jgi:hypothetical protein